MTLREVLMGGGGRGGFPNMEHMTYPEYSRYFGHRNENKIQPNKSICKDQIPTLSLI